FRFGEAVFIAPSTTPTQFDPDAYLQSLQLLASYAPRRMFLTHYGEVGYSGERCELLASQVRDYCDMARRHAGDADGLEATLVEYSLRRLHEIAPCDEERARRWLGFDMRLNAQGLSHWLAASGA
ncbi:MAG: hypothetical protein R3228_01655, partial [Halioglobus sp.]|nr:hypothetical protein [Halioglobus sp.]